MTDPTFANSEEQNQSTDILIGPGKASFFDLSKKGLKQFPTHLYDECCFIKCLYLEGNALQELDESFFPSLQNLQWLDVRGNELQNLPKSVAYHPNLQVLLLEDNRIERLPLELGLVPKLRGIQLSGNPLVFPPPQVIEKGVNGILEFLREERDIQAPSPSTIRPIAEPFYTATEPRERKFKSKSGVVPRKPSVVVKKRASSSNLPLISVKSYQKICQDDTPTRPASCYKLEDSPTPDLPDSIDAHVLWPPLHQMFERNEARIQEQLLKEMFVARIRDTLERQEAIIQRTKDKEVLSSWRKSGTGRTNPRPPESSEWPFDIDPLYKTMLSRAELQEPGLDRRQKPVVAKMQAEMGDEIKEIYNSLRRIEDSHDIAHLSPRSQQNALNDEMQTLACLQKKLHKLHLRNAVAPVPSLPVRGQRIPVST